MGAEEQVRTRRGWGRCHTRMLLSFVGGEFGLDRIYDGKVLSGLAKLIMVWIGVLFWAIGGTLAGAGLVVLGAVLVVGWFIWYIVDLFHYTFLAGKESRGEMD